MARLIAGLALIAIGAALLGLVGWTIVHPTTHYALTLAPAEADARRDIEPLTKAFPERGDPDVEKISIAAPDLRNPAAAGLVARDREQLIPLSWRNNVTEPVLFADLPAADLATVLDALRQHAPEDAVLFAWWDLSRAIRLLPRRNAPLDDPQARGLLIPAPWSEDRAQESARWGAGAATHTAETFGRFVDALLADADVGAAMLRELAKGKPAYIIVHISDVGKLAATRSGLLSIGYRDFPASGVSHGVIHSAKQWLREENIKGPFAAEPVDGALRLHFFHRIEDGSRLIAKLLPFSTSNPAELEGFELVYQFKGYWIYRVKT